MYRRDEKLMSDRQCVLSTPVVNAEDNKSEITSKRKSSEPNI